MTDTRIIKNTLIDGYTTRSQAKSVTLSDIRELIVDGIDIQIVQDTTGDDITHTLLLQIIVEQEQSGGQPILTERLLAQLIRFYGNPMQGMMAEYLQKSVSTFVNQQRSVQSQMQDMLTNTPIDTLRKLVTKNVKTWEAMLVPKGENSGDSGDQTKE